MRLGIQAAVLLPLGLAACSSTASVTPPSIAEVPEAVSLPAVAPPLDAPPVTAARPPSPAPLAGEVFVSLAVPGFKDAVVALPIGATDRRPILIGMHGAGDRPDWQCYEMQRLVHGRGFAVCPRGNVSATFSTPKDVRYEWAGEAAMKKEITAAVSALRARYADYVDDGPMLYEGFSYGASVGVALVSSDPERYPRAIFTEGGSEWTAARARAFADKGGQRVLFACGGIGNVYAAKQAAALLEKAGVRAKVVYGKGEGHGYGSSVATGIQAEFAWLTSGDPRWAP